MENASKALIIAGAILVSILLITIGVLVINLINPVTDETGRTAEGYAVQQFNSQFTGYEGNGVPASQVRALRSAINSSNAAHPDHQVNAGTADAALGLAAWDALAANQTYTVELVYGTQVGVDAGYVVGANVTQD